MRGFAATPADELGALRLLSFSKRRLSLVDYVDFRARRLRACTNTKVLTVGQIGTKFRQSIAAAAFRNRKSYFVETNDLAGRITGLECRHDFFPGVTGN